MYKDALPYFLESVYKPHCSIIFDESWFKPEENVNGQDNGGDALGSPRSKKKNGDFIDEGEILRLNKRMSEGKDEGYYKRKRAKGVLEEYDYSNCSIVYTDRYFSFLKRAVTGKCGRIRS